MSTRTGATTTHHGESPPDRSTEIRRIFGAIRPSRLIGLLPPQLPTGGAIWWIGGPSGGGKTSLLRAWRQQARSSCRPWIDLDRIPLPRRPTIDLLGSGTADALMRLSDVGLGEPALALRTPQCLSIGERWRLRLAIAWQTARQQIQSSSQTTANTGETSCVLSIDEFASCLDPLAEIIVARWLRRQWEQSPRVLLLIASAHPQTRRPLRPHRTFWQQA